MNPLAAASAAPVRRPWMVISVAVVATLLAAWFVLRLQTDASFNRMFPSGDPAATALQRVLDRFSAAEQLLLLVTVPPDGAAAPIDSTASQPAVGESSSQLSPSATADQNAAAARRLLAMASRFENAIADSPSARELIDRVDYRIDPQTRQFFEDVLVPAGIFYLDDAAFAAAQQRLTRPEMDRQLRQDETMLAAPGPAAAALAKIVLKDPLRLHEFLMDRLAAASPLHTQGGTDAIVSPDGRSLLISIVGHRSVSDLDYSRQITQIVRQLADAANTEHLELNLSGGYAIAAASEAGIRHDMILSVTGSVILLAILFAAAYRGSIRIFTLAITPVALGIFWGFGIFGAAGLSLTPMTAVIGAVLAGMGIDYSVQFISQFQSLRDRGICGLDAAAQTSATVAPAMLGAWATSVIGFLAIGASSVRAMRDFSVMGSVGLSGAFLAALLLLPALLVVVSRFTGEARASRPPARSRLRVDMTPLIAALSRHWQLCLAVALALLGASTVILAWPGARFPLESDLTVMHPRPNPALDAESVIARRMGQAPGSLMIELQADSSADLLLLAHRVHERLDAPAVREARVIGSFSLASLLPDPRRTQARLAAVGPAVADRVVADFQAALAQSDFDPAQFAAYSDFLRRLLTPTGPPGIEQLLAYPQLAGPLLPRRSPSQTAEPITESVTYLLLDDPLEDRARRNDAIDSVRQAISDLPGATLTGLAVAGHDVEQAVAVDTPRLVLVALAAVAIYLAIHLRNLLDTLLTLTPTIFGLTVLLAVLRLMGARLNMVNVVALPLLIGIDVDYGVFVVSVARALRAPRSAAGAGNAGAIAGAIDDPGWARRMAPACHAVTVCGLATALGFGSLVTTSVPAVRSLGIAVGLGATACLIGELLLLRPLLFRLSGRAASHSD